MERLEIYCDFNTQQAAENAANLARALSEIRAQVTTTGQAVDKTAEEVKNLGDRAAAAANPIVKFGDGTKQAGQSAGEAGNQYNQFNQTLNQTNNQVNNTTTTINKFTESNQKAGGSLDILSGKLGGVASSLIGLQTVYKLVQQINEQVDAAIQARDRLVGEKLGVDEAILPFLAKKGLSGPRDEGRARAMVLGASQRTLADPATVVKGFDAAQGAGFNVDVDKGSSAAEEAIAFAKRSGMNEGSMASMIKLMGQRRDQLGSAFDPKQFLAQIQAVAQSASQDMGQYITGIMTATDGRAAMGGSWNQGLALYGAASAVTRDPGAASSLVAQYTQAAAGKQQKALGLLSNAAAQQGLIKSPSRKIVDSMSAAELAGKDIAGYSPDAEEAKLVEQIGRETISLGDLSSKRGIEESTHTQRVAKLRKEKGGAAQIPLADAQHQLREREFDEQVSKVTQQLNANKGKLAAYIASRLQQQDFLNLSQDQKEQVYNKLLNDAAHDPELREALIQAGAVNARSLSNTLAMAGVSGQRAMIATRAAVGSASGTSIDRQREGFAKTDLGTASALRIEGIKNTVEGFLPDDVFDKGMDDKIGRAVAQSTERYEFANTKFADQLEIFSKVDPSNGEDSRYSMVTQGGKDSYVKSRALLQEMKTFWDSLTPQEQRDHPQFRDSFEAAERHMRQTLYNSDNVSDANTRSHYSDLRNARNAMARERASRFSTPSAPPNLNPAPSVFSSPAAAQNSGQAAQHHATTQPAKTQPTASPVSYHITTHIGSVYTHSPDLDLPGSLEMT